MSNRLQHESSPYLLQHAQNPVDWYPWGEEALKKAEQENKLIIVSIGYAACHWCHVMEHESFEDEEVANVMNQHFICIKIDREERPDIDKVYMDAVMLMTGQGGWPLNAFALPDGRPIYGGTYFPKNQWLQILQQLADMYKNNPQRAEEYANNLFKAIQDIGNVAKATTDTQFEKEEVANIFSEWLSQIDLKFGGRKTKANKFPLPMNNLSLLRAAKLMSNEFPEIAESIDHAYRNTMEKMAFGGIYDHLGGGFARYSVDAYWKVPHFEKMLYDNGQLVSLYAEAYTANKEKYPIQSEVFRTVVYQTLNFVERELSHPDGGFYSSLDADSEGEEGKYYVWSFDEVEEALGKDAKLFADYYNIHPFGNWEGKNILFILEVEEDFAKRWKLNAADFKELISKGKEKLLKIRSLRTRPGLDDKILASWNGLMLKGYVDAYRAFQDDRFLAKALKNGRFINEHMREGNRLFRNYKEGKRSIPAFLDDYANVIQAFTSLYQVTFDESWLEAASSLLAYTWEHFSDDKSDMFFYTEKNQEVLVKRKIETQDDVIPSSNAVLAHELLTIGLLQDRAELRNRSLQMLRNMKKNIVETPAWHSVWVQLLLRNIYPHYEIAITGPETKSRLLELFQYYIPNGILSGAETASELPLLANRFTKETMIYVCEGYTCQLPVTSVKEAISQLAKSPTP